MKTGKIISVAVLVWMLLVAGCTSGDDANKLAGDLEDRLTDALDFDSGSTQDGAPPEENEGADAPAITSLDTPDELGLGQLFVVRIASEFAQADTVDSAIVYVEGASKYIRVTSGLVAVTGGFEMRLAGILLADEALRNKSFNLKVALHTTGGVTGLYQPWQLRVLDLAASSSTNAALGDAGLSDGTFNETGRPAGDGSSDAPQILGIDAPDSVTPEQQVDVVLYSNNLQTAQDVQAIIVSAPTSDSYWRVTNFEVIPPAAKALGEPYGFKMSVTVPTLPGDVPGMVLLWALEKTNQRVGLYFPWEFSFSQPADGDEDAAEADKEADIQEEDTVILPDGDEEEMEEDVAEETEPETETEEETEEETSIPDPSGWGFQTVFYNASPGSYFYLQHISGNDNSPLSPCVVGDLGEGPPIALCQTANDWETLPPVSVEESTWFYDVVLSPDYAVFLANASFGDLHTYDPENLWTSHSPASYPYADFDIELMTLGPSGQFYMLAGDYRSDTGAVYHLYSVSPDLLTATEIPFEVQNPSINIYNVTSMVAVRNATETGDILYLLHRDGLLKYNGTTLTEEWTSADFTPGYDATVHGSAYNDLWAGGTPPGSTGDAALYHYDGTAWSVMATDIPGGEMGVGAVWSLGDEGVFFVVDDRLYYFNPDYSDAPLEINVDPMGYGTFRDLWGTSLWDMYALKSDRIMKLTFDWPAPICDPNLDMPSCEGNSIVECDYDTWSWTYTDCATGYTCLNDSAYPMCVPDTADGDLDSDVEIITPQCSDADTAYCEGSTLYECIEGVWTPTDCYNQDLMCVTLADKAVCGQCDPADFTSYCSDNAVIYCNEGSQAVDNCTDRQLTCASDDTGAWCESDQTIPESTTWAFTTVFGGLPTGDSIIAYSAAYNAAANPCLIWQSISGYSVLCDGGGNDYSLRGTVPADLIPVDIAYNGESYLMGGNGPALGNQIQNDLFEDFGNGWTAATCSNYPSDDMTIDMIADTGSGTAFFVATNNLTEKPTLYYRNGSAVGYAFTLPDTVTAVYDLDAWWPGNDPIAYLVTNDGIYLQSLTGEIVQEIAVGDVGFEPGCSVSIDRNAGHVWASGYDRVAGHPVLIVYDGEGWAYYPIESIRAATGQVGDLWPVDIDTVLFIYGDQVLYYVLGGLLESIPWDNTDINDKPRELEGIDISVVYLRTDRTVQAIGRGTSCTGVESYCDGVNLYQCMGGQFSQTNCLEFGSSYTCTTCEGGHQCGIPCTQTDLSFCDGDVLNTCYWCGDGGYWNSYDCADSGYICIDGASPYCAAP